MFGYLRAHRRRMTGQMRKAYRNYYCGTCFALQKHYGLLSRLLLSYDVILLGILLKSHEQPLGKRLWCYGQWGKKRQFANDEWKSVAAITVLLTAGKLDDDIVDDNSLLAKMASFVFAGQIKQARRDYPEISAAITSGYKQIYTHEQEGQSVEVIAADFSAMMETVYRQAHTNGELIAEKTRYIKAVSAWLYFIDALDDYGKDLERKRFNPLLKEGVSHIDYINKHLAEIHRLVQHFYGNLMDSLKGLPQEAVEDELLANLANNTVPLMTATVLKRNAAPRSGLFRQGMVWGNV